MSHFLRAPFYTLLALGACAYLASANARGWSPWMPFTPKPTALHGAPVRHK